ncbi:TIGR02117 family protein [Flavobacterium sp. Sd200]|uniref:TIGR02117 family protein n=1 Tax=Flavobacterium sp. Sd200 TaxID=2692211 RepID=UPI00136DACBD|nr:TIGR02117 family protein [Flavobacterium sp. Sd200]MXN90446.1 TIGR02117 family protein [Flavobacterium sp. Sd200]
MNKNLRKAFKITGKILLGILGFVLIYILSVLALSRITVNSKPQQGGDVAIYINSNGVHTDIVVPLKNNVKDWTKDVLYAHTTSKDSIAKYVAFGWGDKGFYLDTPEWSDLKASTAFKAAFYLGTSAMHTRFYKEMKEDDECVKIMITQQNYKDLVAFITESFQYDEGKKMLWIQNHSYGRYDAFYEAMGCYSLFYTCNTWANNALKAAHQKAALWTVYDKGIFLHYR